MRVLIIGSGGREHALGWRLVQDAAVERVFFLPGNGGTRQVGVNVPGPISDDRVAETIDRQNIDLLVFGPEDPLIAGMADRIRERFGERVAVVGPGAEGARLEGSKADAKDFMQRHGIPTAQARIYSRAQQAQLRRYLQDAAYPLVLKASGPAAGKGVVICESPAQALATVSEFFEKERFGASGHTVVVEQFLRGREVSVFILTDGQDYRRLAAARDYKRAFDADRGPNTGGMGAFTPVEDISKALWETIHTRIIRPTLEGLRKDGVPFRGFIFFGLMIVEGAPYVLEYNVRLGDPETQVIMPMIEGPWAEVLAAAARGRLKEAPPLTFKGGSRLAVIAASQGYPGSYEKGKPIEGLEEAAAMEGVAVFHAGTRYEDGRYYTAGGRVLAVSAWGPHRETARQRAYEALRHIRFEGMFFRNDIGM